MKYIAIAVVLVCAVSLRAQEAAPAPAPVTVTEDPAFYTLDNGIIKALISRKSGDIVSMKFKGKEMMATWMKEDGTPDLDRDPPGDPGWRGGGMTDHMYGFWSHDTQADRIESKITIDPKANSGVRAEVSVKGFSDGKQLGHGPGAPPEGDFAADIEIRYALNRGETGVYTYCIFEKKAEYPASEMGEARFCAKLHETFDWMIVDESRNFYYPRERAPGDNKYNYTAVQWENPVFGWASTTQNIGFFLINASVEYLTGPPTKVEFQGHRDTSAPLYAPTVLNYWRSSHYGGGGVDVAAGEYWTKVIGPIMLYCNTGTSPNVIWADALAQQKKEAAKWPYNWVNGVDYPHKEQRATVSGQLVLSDPQAPDAKLANMRVGLAHPPYRVTTGRQSATNAPADIHWQVDSKHYEFWVRGNADGSFSIPTVRAGKYNLHAFSDGVLGEFLKTEVVVEPGKNLDLGKLKWTPVRKGRQIWEVGFPNRTGAEYVKGRDHFHDNMAMVYALLFPDNVNYTIGKSVPDRDWFYLHTTRPTDAAIAAATVEAQPARGRGAGGFGAGAATQPGGGRRGRGLARGGPATQPEGIAAVPATQPGAAGGRRGRGFGVGAGGDPNAPATQPGGAAGAFARGGGARGGAGGGAAGAGPRPTPWNINFDMPTAPRGKATLRLGIATNNTQQIIVSVNGQEAGRLDNLPTESSIGRNANRGIWFEREVPFEATMLKAGANTVTLTIAGGGVIYDYLRLELDDGAQTALAN